MTKRSLLVLVVVIVAGILVLSGCANTTTTPATTQATTTTQATSPTTTTDAKYGGTFIRLLAFGPGGSFYPPEAVMASAEDEAPAVEGLIYMDCHGVITPKLATAWEIAPDQSSITFTLRQGVKFHDDTDFNAAAAKWAMNEYIAAKRAPSWKSVDVIDDHTIKLNFNYWENLAYQDLMARIFTSPTAFEKNGLEWSRLHPIGTGAYKFVSFERDVELIFTRNNNYWDKPLPYLDGIEYHFIADKMTMTAAFKAGQGNTMSFGTLQAVAQLRDEGFQVLTALTVNAHLCPNALYPDSGNPDSPLSNPQVRIALEYAIDKPAIANARGFGFWEPAYQIPNTYDPLDYNPALAQRTYDPAKARELLEAAGFGDGFACSIIVQPGLQDPDTAQAIAGYFQDVGVDCTVELPDMGKFVDYTLNGWSNGFLMYGLPPSFNFAGWCKYQFSRYSTTAASMQFSDTYSNALDAALRSLEPEPGLMQALAKAAYDEQVVIPLFYVFEGDPVRPGIHEYHMPEPASITNYTPEPVWLDPEARIK
jgi:peptide/nickel transport system substrate-binding protein